MTTGIMQQIRERLAGGQSSGEVIAGGFAPPTVYKVQRQLRRRDQNGAGRSVVLAQPDPVTTEAAKRIRELEAQVEGLEDEVDSMSEDAVELVKTQGELVKAESKLKGLEAEWDEVCRRVIALESGVNAAVQTANALVPEAQEAGRLREKVTELERDLRRANAGQAEMRRSASEWQQKYEGEQTARVEAERQWQLWHATAQQLKRDNQALTQTVAELEPLRVWDGHPCKVCKSPLRGGVSQENAARLMQDFGHTACLKNDSGPGLTALAIGAATLWGLSQTRERS